MESRAELEVFYDGLCRVCAAEIDVYRKREISGRILWTDISAPEFDPQKIGLDRESVQRELHSRKSDGRLLTGVETFLAIWEIVPGFTWMKKLVDNPVMRPLANLGYQGFVRLRPYLPRKAQADCTDGVCDARLKPR